MNADTSARLSLSELEDFERIVAACDRFEAAWKSGDGRPTIEDYLSGSPDRERPALLLDLLELELELRRSSGEQPSREEYLTRFPDCESLIATAFSNTEGQGGGTGSAIGRPWSSAVSGQRFGDYELLEEVATGGMGIVYKARQISLDRLIALKMILVGRFASDDEVLRFHREARAAAWLRHPGIVSVFDFGVYQERPYIAMDFIEGPSLAAKAAGGPLPQAEAALMVERLAEAVHFAHGRGVIHRDLKPSNVLLDGQGKPLLTDFGLAKRVDVDGSLTVTGQILGTPSYMPPEQARGEHERDVGPASDVYALGATLYFLVTGRPPFQAATAVETLRLVLETEPVPPRQLNPGVGRDLETICLKCLHKEPRRRYATAEALSRDLARCRAGEPIEARPVGVVEKAIRWSRKNRELAGMGAAAFGLALMLVVGALVYTIRLNSALQTAKHALVRRYVRDGMKSLEEGDDLSALPWFVKALQLEQGDPQRESVHRMRIASVLSRCPKLVAIKRPDPVDVLGRLSPDGRRVVRLDGTKAQVFDAATKAPTASPFVHRDPVKMAEFSLDGQRVVTAAGRLVQVWDVATGAALTPPLEHRDVVNEVSFSPDGQLALAAVGGRDGGTIGEAVAWQVATAKPAFPPLRHEDDVYVAHFSTDGRRVVTGSYDHTARVWDAITGAAVTPALRHSGPVNLASFSADGTRVVTVSGNEARVWDATTGASATPRLQHRGPIRRVAFDAGGRRLATEGADLRVRFWDTVTGETLLPAIPSSSTVEIAFEADARRFSTKGPDRYVRIWDPATTEPELPVLRHHTHFVVCAAYHPDGRKILTASADGSWRIWDSSNGRPVTPAISHAGPIEWASFSPKGDRIVTASRDHTAQVWNAETGARVSAPMKHDYMVLFATFSPDGRRVVTTSNDGTARLWDASSGKPLAAPMQHGQMVSHAAFHPDGERLATASVDNTALIWNLVNGQRAILPLRHADWVVRVAFSPDGQSLVTASRDHTARAWDTTTGRELTPPLRHDDAVTDAAFSPDSLRIVTASADRSARVWDAKNGAPLTPPLKHGERVNRAVFTHDGLCVLTAAGEPEGDHGEARLWDASTGDAIINTLRHGDDVTTVALSPDERHILTASCDTTAKVWAVSKIDVPVDDLVVISEVLSGARIDDTGGLLALSSREMANAWEKLQARHPEVSASLAADQATWHAREADACERRKIWTGAALHLKRVVAFEPQRWDLRSRLAGALAELGKWSEATEQYAEAAKLGSDDPKVWDHWALTLLARDDLPGYRRVKLSALERFQESTDPTTRNLLAWALVVGQDDDEQSETAVNVARRALEGLPGESKVLDTLGAALYRAGQWEESTRRLNEAMKNRTDEGEYTQWLFLAMAHARLGHPEEARGWLERADAWWAMSSEQHPGAPEAAPSPITWQDRIQFRLLREEAARLLPSAQASTPLSPHGS